MRFYHTSLKDLRNPENTMQAKGRVSKTHPPKGILFSKIYILASPQELSQSIRQETDSLLCYLKRTLVS